MDIIVVGLNHDSAPVQTREKLVIPENRLDEAFKVFKSKNPEVLESVIISTCNRVEIYARTTDIEQGMQGCKNFFAEYNEIDKAELGEVLYSYQNEDAIEHLFKVASSLDSMIIGEPQILGQVKLAYKMARNNFATGMILNQLFEHSFLCAKKVRTNTTIGENPVSVAYAVVELTEKIFGDLQDKTVLLVGGGEMIELSAKYMVAKGVKTVLISNRTTHRAIALARKFAGETVRFDNLAEELKRADIVITSTGAPHFVIRTTVAKEAMLARNNLPIFFVDIAVPRDIEPSINDLENCYLYDIDDLKSVIEANKFEREKEAKKAFKIIKEEVDQFVRWTEELELAPLIIALRKFGNDIRKSELAKFKNKFQNISDSDFELVDRLSESIVNKIIHTPITTIKKNDGSYQGPYLIRAVKYLFGFK